MLGANVLSDQSGGLLDVRLAESGSPDQAESKVLIPLAWLRRHCTSPAARELRRQSAQGPARRLWGADLLARTDAPCFDLGAVLSSPPPPPSVRWHPSHSSGQDPPGSDTVGSPLAELLRTIRTFGIALVRGVPGDTDDKAIEELSLRLAGYLRGTLYGAGMWATSADPDKGEHAYRDSAYSNGALRSHTDCTYFTDPPGLQVRKHGGASSLVEGRPARRVVGAT